MIDRNTTIPAKKSGTKIEILCSLGINNIKNYDASPGQKIIIAADNDKVSVDEKYCERKGLRIIKKLQIVESSLVLHPHPIHGVMI